MYTARLLALVAAILAPSAVAQSLPSCASSCLTSDLGGCGQFQYKCICTNVPFLTQLACCVSQKCDAAGQADTIAFADKLCAGQGVTNLPQTATCPSPSSAATSTSSPASSSASAAAASTTDSSSASSSSSAATTVSTSSGTVVVVTSGSSSSSGTSESSTATTLGAAQSSSTASASTTTSSGSGSRKTEAAKLGVVVAGLFALL